MTPLPRLKLRGTDSRCCMFLMQPSRFKFFSINPLRCKSHQMMFSKLCNSPFVQKIKNSAASVWSHSDVRVLNNIKIPQEHLSIKASVSDDPCCYFNKYYEETLNWLFIIQHNCMSLLRLEFVHSGWLCLNSDTIIQFNYKLMMLLRCLKNFCVYLKEV
jgi:hypothetical protein